LVYDASLLHVSDGNVNLVGAGEKPKWKIPSCFQKHLEKQKKYSMQNGNSYGKPV